MMKFGLIALLGLVTFILVAAEPSELVLRQNQFVEYALQQGKVYMIYVKKDDGCTTVTFPSKIGKIAGFNVATDNTKDFQLSAKPGSYYFNVTALTERASGTLTITYNRNTYILYLQQVPNEAYAAVNFYAGRPRGVQRTGNNIVTETPKVPNGRLISMIDLAKTYDMMSDTHPDSVANVTRKRYNSEYHFSNFSMTLLDVFRFEDEDTLIFKVLLINPNSQEIEYDKHTLSVQVGNELHYMSVADASGVMPPRSQTFAFFGITSTPRGGRNNLSVDNRWMLGVTTKDMHNDIANIKLPIPPKTPEQKALEAKTAELDAILEKVREAKTQLETEKLKQQEAAQKATAALQVELKKVQELKDEKAKQQEADQKAAAELQTQLKKVQELKQQLEVDQAKQRENDQKAVAALQADVKRTQELKAQLEAEKLKQQEADQKAAAELQTQLKKVQELKQQLEVDQAKQRENDQKAATELQAEMEKVRELKAQLEAEKLKQQAADQKQESPKVSSGEYQPISFSSPKPRLTPDPDRLMGDWIKK